MSNISKLLFIAFCFWLQPLALFAQQPYYRSLNIGDGLPTPTIYNLKSSRSGHLWMGTELGLVRYNGQQFTLLPSKDTRSFAVTDIAEDKKGVIWCRNFSNQILYLKDDTLRVEPKIMAVLDSFPSLSEVKLIGNRLWFATSRIIGYYDTEQDVCEVVVHSPQPTTLGIVNVIGQTLEFVHTLGDNPPTLVYGKWKVKSYDIPLLVLNFTTRNYNKKNYLLGKGAMAREFYEIGSTGIQKVIDLSFIADDTYVFHSEELADGLWICTNNGVYPLSSPGKSLLPDKRVSCIVQDYQGNYWISTLDDGLYCMPDKSIQWFYRDLSSKAISKLGWTLDGKLLAGTPEGEIRQLDQNGKVLVSYISKFKGDISYILQDSTSGFILSTSGAYQIGQKTPMLNYLLGKDMAISHELKQVYVAYAEMVVRADFSKMGFGTEFIKAFGNGECRTSLRGIRGRAVVYEPKHQRFWVAYADELYYYDAQGNGRILSSKEGKPITAMSLSSDNKGGIWAATASLGLLHIADTNIVAQYTKSNGLSSDNCRQILLTRKGDVVVQTQLGLDFVISDGKTRPIDLQSILGIGRINIRSLSLSKQDRLYIATGSGILSTDLPNFQELQRQTKITLQLFSSNTGKEISAKEPLGYKDANLTFKFEAIDYRLPRNARWMFRMVGMTKQWSYLPIENAEINFVGLAAGNYEFQLKIEGQEESAVSCAFSVESPFWKRWWFVLIAGILMFVIIYLSFRYLLSKAQKRQSLQHQLSLSRITALRAQMNPHFLYNALNTVSGYIYANRKGDAGNYLSSFSELTRHILDMSGKEKVRLDEELNALKLYLMLEEGRLEGQDFIYGISVSKAIDQSATFLPPLLLQPYIENCIKHGLIHKVGTKRLSIVFDLNDEGHLLIGIDDNGIGRVASAAINEKRGKKSAGFSTAANKDRIDLLNLFRKKPILLDIIDKQDSQTGTVSGTKVLIVIPFEE